MIIYLLVYGFALLLSAFIVLERKNGFSKTLLSHPLIVGIIGTFLIQGSLIGLKPFNIGVVEYIDRDKQLANIISYAWLFFWFGIKLRAKHKITHSDGSITIPTFKQVDLINKKSKQKNSEYIEYTNEDIASKPQSKVDHANEGLLKGTERRSKKSGINKNSKVLLYSFLFFFLIAPIFVLTIESFENLNTVPQDKQPSLDEINADIRKAYNTEPKVETPTSDVSGVKIEFSGFDIPKNVLSDSEIETLRSVGINKKKVYPNMKLKVINYRPSQINGVMFKMKLFDLFDRPICDFSGLGKDWGLSKTFDFQKTIAPNTYDFVMVAVPFDCQIDPTKQYKYLITILRVV